VEIFLQVNSDGVAASKDLPSHYCKVVVIALEIIFKRQETSNKNVDTGLILLKCQPLGLDIQVAGCAIQRLCFQVKEFDMLARFLGHNDGEFDVLKPGICARDGECEFHAGLIVTGSGDRVTEPESLEYLKRSQGSRDHPAIRQELSP
jgi:hypothetical protein